MKSLPSFSWKNLDPVILSKAFFTLSIIILVCVPIDVLAVTFIPSYTASAVRPAKMMIPGAFQAPTSDDIAVYKQGFRSSKVFGALSIASPQETVSIDKVISNLSLKGIITIGAPEAIIERKDTRTTAFVQKGASFQSLTVKDIYEDSLVLSDGTDDRILKIGSGL